MSNYLFVFILTTSLITCHDQKVPSNEWIYINDYQRYVVMKIKPADSFSTAGFYYPSREDSVKIVLTSWRGDMSIDSLLMQYQMVLSKTPGKERGVMLVLTDSTKNNTFRLLNYSKPDSAFYAHRLAIGGKSRNIEFDNDSFVLARLYFFNRQ